MRKFLFHASTFIAIAAAIEAIPSGAQAQPYYGGMMGGYGYGMMGGYGPRDRYAMGPGMMGEYGYGPGMMYGYSSYGARYYYHHGRRYRGQHCWHETRAGESGGYYRSCSK